MNILLTVEELAKYLKIKPDTIYKKVRKGELPAIKLGKLVRFPKELIDQWIIEQATKTMKEVRAAAKAVNKAASKAFGDVPEVIEDVKKAPLDKKQETLARGLKTLWKEFNSELGTRNMARARKPKAKARSKGKKASANGKAGAHKVSTEPVTTTSA